MYHMVMAIFHLAKQMCFIHLLRVTGRINVVDDEGLVRHSDVKAFSLSFGFV